MNWGIAIFLTASSPNMAREVRALVAVLVGRRRDLVTVVWPSSIVVMNNTTFGLFKRIPVLGRLGSSVRTICPIPVERYAPISGQKRIIRPFVGLLW